MALAYDTSGSVGGTGTGPFTFSLSPSGSDRVMIAGVVYYHINAVVSAITFNSVSLTEVPGSAYDPGGDYHIRWYYLIAPATSSNTFSITFSGTGVYDAGIVVYTFTGAQQVTPYGTTVNGTATSTTPSVTVSSATDEIVVDALIITHSGTLSVGAGQTERANAITSTGYTKYGGSTEGGAASTTMSWSNSTSQFWALSGLPVKPAATASTTRHLGTTGVGT